MKALADVSQIQQYMQMPGFGFGRWADIQIVSAQYGQVDAEVVVREDMSRPGGTVAGPVLMGLADAAMWGAAMTIHAQGNQSVTSDFTIHFLKRPAAVRLRCRAQVIKSGKTLLVMRADIRCDDSDVVVCACQGSYAIGPKPIIDAQ